MTMNNDALTWVIIVAITGVGANIAIIVGVWKRKPPLEGQFADQAKNEADHERLHRRIGDLRTECEGKFVPAAMYAREIAQRDDFRHTTDKKLDKLLTGLSALAAKSGVEIQL